MKIHEIPTDVKFCSTDLLQDFCLQSVQLPLEGEINHKTLPNLSLCKIGGGAWLRFLQSRPGVCPSRPLSCEKPSVRKILGSYRRCPYGGARGVREERGGGVGAGGKEADARRFVLILLLIIVLLIILALKPGEQKRAWFSAPCYRTHASCLVKMVS